MPSSKSQPCGIKPTLTLAPRVSPRDLSGRTRLAPDSQQITCRRPVCTDWLPRLRSMASRFGVDVNRTDSISSLCVNRRNKKDVGAMCLPAHRLPHSSIDQSIYAGHHHPLPHPLNAVKTYTKKKQVHKLRQRSVVTGLFIRWICGNLNMRKLMSALLCNDAVSRCISVVRSTVDNQSIIVTQ